MGHLGLAIVFVFAQFAVKMHDLASFPPFVDEGNFMEWSRGMWQGVFLLYPLAHGRWLPIVYQALFWPFQSTLWVGRSAAVVIGSLAPVALYRLGMALMRNRWVAASAAVIYACLPIVFLHDRMILSEAPTASLVLLSALALVSFAHRPRARHIVLIGLLLGAAVLSRVNAAGVLLLPLLGTFGTRRWQRPAHMLRLGTASLLGLAIAAVPYGIAFRLYGILFNRTTTDIRSGTTDVLARFTPALIARRMAANGVEVIDLLATYGTWILVIGVVVGIVLVLVVRRPGAVFAAAALLSLWLPVLALANSPYPRNYIAGLSFAVLLGIWGLDETSAWLGRQLSGRTLGLGWLTSALATIIVWRGASFAYLAYTDPLSVPLLPLDRYQYFNSDWGSGTGYAEIAQRITEGMAVSRQTVVYADQQEFWRFLLVFPEGRPNASLRITGNRDNERIIASLRNGAVVFYLWDKADSEFHLEIEGVSATLVTAYTHSGRASRLEVYELKLEARGCCPSSHLG